MELTKKGWSFGMVIVTLARWEQGNPFPGLADKNGNPIVSDGNSLLLVADNPQKLLVCLTNQAQDI